MKDDTRQQAEGAGLTRLLRGARPEPSLPPGFQQAVWLRVERQETRPTTSIDLWAWLRILVPQPRLALVSMVVIAAAGATLGVRQGAEEANAVAKAHYMDAVSPMPVR